MVNDADIRESRFDRIYIMNIDFDPSRLSSPTGRRAMRIIKSHEIMIMAPKFFE